MFHTDLMPDSLR